MFPGKCRKSTTEVEEEESGRDKATPPNQAIPVEQRASLIDNLLSNSVKGSVGGFFLKATHQNLHRLCFLSLHLTDITPLRFTVFT